MIDPRVASGTRDILPTVAIHRERIQRRFRDTFEEFGFVPIDTPVLERREVLFAKGGADVQRQVFQVAQRGQSLDESELALRFDLTVPLARYVAAHVDQLGVPFKRYHIGIVFRGERAQRGRYREFYQCDFDVIGPRSDMADAEIALVICRGLIAVGIAGYSLRLNNRKLLDGLLERLGLTPHREHVLRALDKMSKVGREQVLHELQFGALPDFDSDGGDSPTQTTPDAPSQNILARGDAERLLDTVQGIAAPSADTVLDQCERELGTIESARSGVANLRAVCDLLRAGGVSDERLRIDIGLARGLDYYTGVIFETTINGHENLGSVCSGGRYDDLASLFTSRQLPGVGASFGLDRLVQLMSDAGWLAPSAATAPVLIVNFQAADQAAYVRAAMELRTAGIGCEIYPEPKSIRDQLGYASARGYRFAVVLGPDEIATGTFALRDMTTRVQRRSLPRHEFAGLVFQALKGADEPRRG